MTKRQDEQAVENDDPIVRLTIDPQGKLFYNEWVVDAEPTGVPKMIQNRHTGNSLKSNYDPIFHLRGRYGIPPEADAFIAGKSARVVIADNSVRTPTSYGGHFRQNIYTDGHCPTQFYRLSEKDRRMAFADLEKRELEREITQHGLEVLESKLLEEDFRLIWGNQSCDRRFDELLDHVIYLIKHDVSLKISTKRNGQCWYGTAYSEKQLKRMYESIRNEKDFMRLFKDSRKTNRNQKRFKERTK